MKDPDGVEHDLLCSIADMEKKKEEGWIMVFSPPKNSLIGHTGDVISHTSEDWNSVLKNIKSHHPGSTIQTKY
jgi:hypothetical protein